MILASELDVLHVTQDMAGSAQGRRLHSLLATLARTGIYIFRFSIDSFLLLEQRLLLMQGIPPLAWFATVTKSHATTYDYYDGNCESNE